MKIQYAYSYIPGGGGKQQSNIDEIRTGMEDKSYFLK